MSISYEAIINQMLSRLANAKHDKNDKEKLIKHIYHVHGLCELLIEEMHLTHDKMMDHDIEQIKKMTAKKPEGPYPEQVEKNDSIFDF